MGLMNWWKGKGRPKKARRAFRLEALEDRWVPAGIFLDAAGTLHLTGEAGADTIQVARGTSGGTVAQVNSVTAPFAAGLVKAVVIKGGDGADVINVHSTEPGVGVTVDAGAGDDQMDVHLSGPAPSALGGLAAVDGGAGNDRIQYFDVLNSAATSYSVSSISLTRTRGGVTTNVSHSGAEDLTLHGGRGANTYSVESNATGTSLKLFGGIGADTFHLSPSGHDLDGIGGTVTITGQGGTDHVTFDDSSNQSATEYAITATGAGTQHRLVRQNAQGATTYFYDAETVGVLAGAKQDAFIIDGLAALTTTSLQGGAGEDRVEVARASQDLDAIRGGLTFNGGDDADSLLLDDSRQDAATTYSLSSSVVTRASGGQSASVSHLGVESISVRGGTAANTFAVEGTAKGTVTALVGGVANDQFQVTPIGGNLDTIVGELTVSGGAGTDTVTVNDTSHDKAGSRYRITHNALHRNFIFPTRYFGVEELSLSSSVSAIYDVESTDATVRTRIFAGAADDTFNLAPTLKNLDALAGAVDIRAGDGEDKVFLHDGNNGVSATYSLDVGGISRAGLVAARVNLLGHEEVDITAGFGDDRLELVGVVPTTSHVSFDAGGGSDTVAGTNSADNFFTVTGNNAGVVRPFGSPSGTVVFTSMENLSGGALNDHFRFLEAGRISGRAEGKAGTDSLDYSRRGTGVAVDLAAGAASATGGVAGMENVYGGSAADVITGDDGANVLLGDSGNDVITGRGGNDIVIGGTGADRLDGGAGEDILIGGTTAHDSNPQALLALMSEWKSAAPYATRVAHLRGDLPGGLNGNFFLEASGPEQTVFDDESADVLTGAGDLDWFFIGLGDTTDRLKVELAN